MRANNKIYHIDCFRCFACNKHLAPGDEYSLREDDLFCKTDTNAADKQFISNSNSTSSNTANTCQNITNMPLTTNKILIKCEDIQQNEFNGLFKNLIINLNLIFE